VITEVEKRGNYYFKREDLFCVNGVCGGKVRTCLALAQGETKGLITAGSRQSPQANIVAHIAQHLGIKAKVHTPTGQLSPELINAKEIGAEVIQHQYGYNTVIVKRARDNAEELGWLEIPFGMECETAIIETSQQVENIPKEIKRIVISVGSGMSLAGVLHGLIKFNRQDIHVLGVQVGADPIKRLDKYAPTNWREMVTIVKSELDYHKHAPCKEIEGIKLDPVYEGKCVPFLEKGDLFWIVGVRKTV